VSDRRRDDDPERGGLPPGLELPPVYGGGGAGARRRAHQGGRGECQGRGSPLPRLAEVGAVRFPPLFLNPVISLPAYFSLLNRASFRGRDLGLRLEAGIRGVQFCGRRGFVVN
jgi:hypothetical protein